MDQLRAKAAQWNVTLEETLETATSLLGFGVRDGQRVVLKIINGAHDELHSGKVLRAFGGRGAVRVLEAELGAVLLERLDPGEQLVNVVKRGDDDEATRILAGVIQKLAHQTPPAECPTVADWGRGFDRYLRGGDAQIPHGLVSEARVVYEEMVASQGRTMLLHGDLQHYNVLFDHRRGWMAIDPKGVAGELEYEVGALLRNPVELPELFSNRTTVERRLKILTTLLPLDHSRALKWSFAQAVLSAIWSVEDGYQVQPNNPSLLLANTLWPMISHAHGGVGHSES
ncbi:MAG TPA: aminoglycoside phosphotransferase family protein [Pyrinomonadaceae bacterium]|nr:aminoglycoside phosphotransferase family protein [Pyrinomonadaceae bacterium]